MQNTLMAVMDLRALLAESKTEVDVLVPVDERLVEPLDRLKRLASDQRRRGRDCLKRTRAVGSGVVAREPQVDVSRNSFNGYRDAGVLDRVVWIEEFASDDGNVRVGVSVGDEPVDPTGGRNRVVI